MDVQDDYMKRQSKAEPGEVQVPLMANEEPIPEGKPRSSSEIKSILKQQTVRQNSAQPRRMSTVQDQKRYNALAGKIGNLDDLLGHIDDGLIDTSMDTHKTIIQDLAQKVSEDPPRYAIKAVYNEFLPCLQKINKHYHKIAVGTSAEHPYLKDCDARLEWAKTYVGKMADLI